MARGKVQQALRTDAKRINIPKLNFASGASRLLIGPMADISTNVDAVRTANCGGVARERVRRAEQLAAGADDALAFPDHRHDRAAAKREKIQSQLNFTPSLRPERKKGGKVCNAPAKEVDKVLEEGLTRQVGVVLLDDGALRDAHAHRDEFEALVFEFRDDFADEASLACIGLRHDLCGRKMSALSDSEGDVYEEERRCEVTHVGALNRTHARHGDMAGGRGEDGAARGEGCRERGRRRGAEARSAAGGSAGERGCWEGYESHCGRVNGKLWEM